VVSYVSLFQAQKFFWENFIQDEENARVSEAHLFRMFEKPRELLQNPIYKIWWSMYSKANRRGKFSILVVKYAEC
jgi:hypothetical protein